jgi:hypothetical protein
LNPDQEDDLLLPGTTSLLMAGCLDVYAASADQKQRQRQELLTEMFTAA